MSNAVTELDVLWITAGLSCDGDTIAMTAATQPSIEDVLRGQIPWIPKVNLHDPFPLRSAYRVLSPDAHVLWFHLRSQNDSQG